MVEPVDRRRADAHIHDARAPLFEIVESTTERVACVVNETAAGIAVDDHVAQCQLLGTSRWRRRWHPKTSGR